MEHLRPSLGNDVIEKFLAGAPVLKA
jgi:hypothetical protein